MKLSTLFIFLIISFGVSAQEAYWQQHLKYNIQASLNDKEKSINGSETIVYKNNSQHFKFYLVPHLAQCL